MKKIFFLLLCFSFHTYANCPSDKPLNFLTPIALDSFNEHGGKTIYEEECYGCKEPSALPTLKDTCDLCPNRYYDYKENLCILKTNCPIGKYATLDGKCMSCDENDAEARYALETECRKCPQRIYRDRKCVKCSKGKIASSDGVCQSCDNRYSIYLLDKDDKSCPNRITQKQTEDTYTSVLKECPKNYPIKNILGDCLTCEILGDPTYSIGVSKEDCKKCGGLYQGNLCLPKDRPLVTKKYGFSHSCDENDELKTTPENCALCPNRKYVDGKCILRNVKK